MQHPRFPAGSTLATSTLASAGHCCSPDTLHYSPKDQHRESRGEGADDTARGKTRESHGEDTPDPEEVRDPPVKRDADGVGERVSGNHPTHLRRRGPELALMRGMRTLIMVAVSTEMKTDEAATARNSRVDTFFSSPGLRRPRSSRGFGAPGTFPPRLPGRADYGAGPRSLHYYSSSDAARRSARALARS